MSILVSCSKVQRDDAFNGSPACAAAAYSSRFRIPYAFALVRGRDLLEDFHLAIDAQNLGHLDSKVRVTLLQVVAHLVRLDLLRIKEILSQPIERPKPGGSNKTEPATADRRTASKDCATIACPSPLPPPAAPPLPPGS
jgi:hypothetical protein